MECVPGNGHFGTGAPDNNESTDTFSKIRLVAPTEFSQLWQP